RGPSRGASPADRSPGSIARAGRPGRQNDQPPWSPAWQLPWSTHTSSPTPWAHAACASPRPDPVCPVRGVAGLPPTDDGGGGTTRRCSRPLPAVAGVVVIVLVVVNWSLWSPAVVSVDGRVAAAERPCRWAD